MVDKLRWALARLPLPMLALAASYGVFSFSLLFVPAWIAFVQAGAFECVYVGLAVTLNLDANTRRRATTISVGAVVASIIYNTLSAWFYRQPQLLEQASAIAWLALSLLHGAPLAWVAYLVSDLLLHSATPAPAPQEATVVQLTTARAIAKDTYPCPKCNLQISLGAYGAAMKNGYCSACKGVEQTTNGKEH